MSSRSREDGGRSTEGFADAETRGRGDAGNGSVTASPRHPLSASVLWCASVAHFLNDGLTYAVVLLLPFMAADLGLSYSQSGMIKGALNALISLCQLPAGFLATGSAEATFLGLGLGWFAGAFLLMGLAGGYLTVLALMALAGVGGGVYHPVGTAWVSRVFMGGRRGAAVGTLNLAGDVGKVVLPALAGVLVVWIGWRLSLVALGALGVLAAAAILVAAWQGRGAEPRSHKGHEEEPVKLASLLGGSSLTERLGIARPGQFFWITAIGFVDQAQRAAVTAFLGFLLLQKGFPEASLGFLMAVTFAGGGFGKFGCGLLTDRFEDRKVMALMETSMAAGSLLLAISNPGWLLVPFLLVFGFALNGTSSVIYTRLADTLQPENFSRGYGLYYTLSFGSSAIAPVLYGLLADRQGLVTVYVIIALVTLCILPMLFMLKGTIGTEGNRHGS